MTVEAITKTMGTFATFNLLLVDEDKFTTEYLTSIGQP